MKASFHSTLMCWKHYSTQAKVTFVLLSPVCSIPVRVFYLAALHLNYNRSLYHRGVISLVFGHITIIAASYDCNCCQSTAIFVYTKVIYLFSCDFPFFYITSLTLTSSIILRHKSLVMAMVGDTLNLYCLPIERKLYITL